MVKRGKILTLTMTKGRKNNEKLIDSRVLVKVRLMFMLHSLAILKDLRRRVLNYRTDLFIFMN